MRSDRLNRSPMGLKIAAAAGLAFLHLPILLIFLYAFTTEEKSYQFPPPGLTAQTVLRTLGTEPVIEVTLRFLQLQRRTVQRRIGDGFEIVPELVVAGQSWVGWDEAVECSCAFSVAVATENAHGAAEVAVPAGEDTELLTEPDGTVAGRLLRTRRAVHATVTVEGSMGTSMFQYDLGNGQNFLTIVATGGETILSTTIDYPLGFADLRQPRISGATLVPEPGTLALAGIGLGTAGLAGLRRRMRRNPA